MCTHTDTHKLSTRGVCFHTPAPSGLLPTSAASNRSRASLALTPHLLSCSCHPSPGAGSSPVCTCHHNKPDGEGARDEMLTGKFLPSSACRAWLALQSTTVYSPYKNIYIEAACSMHIRPMASDLGRPQCHIQVQEIARLPSEPSTSKAGQKPASITESLSKSYIWILVYPGRRGWEGCADQHS